MDQDRAAESVVVDAPEREVVHHHRHLIRARNEPRTGDRNGAVPDQDEQDRKTGAEHEGAQLLQPLPVAAAIDGVAAAMLRSARSEMVVAWSFTVIGYMNCSVIARDMSGAWRTCFFSTMSSL